MINIVPARSAITVAVATVMALSTVVMIPAGAAAAPTPRCGPRFSDQLTAEPWPLQRLRPDLAWPLSRGQGVVVAVIDSGVSTLHPAFTGQVLPGTDFVAKGKNTGTCDADGHGTLVAGIIAGRDTPASPFHGVAPAARILPVRVLANRKPSTDPALSQRIAAAITWAVDHGATVINLSLYTPDTPALRAAVRRAAQRDVVLVAAAGNDGGGSRGDQKVYPAAYDEVIAVAGIDSHGAHVNTSSSGEFVDIAAPGLAIEGPAPQGGGYVIDTQGGTSYAAAYVSGVAALIRSHDPGLRADEVRQRLLLTADPPADDRNSHVGYGVINPYRAVASITTTAEPADPDDPGSLADLPRPAQSPRRIDTIAPVAGVSSALIAAFALAVTALRRRRRGSGDNGRSSETRSRSAWWSNRTSTSFTSATSDISLESVTVATPSVRRIGSPTITPGPFTTTLSQLDGRPRR